MEIDTWVGASGKNGMRRDWIIRSQATGVTYARATRYKIYASKTGKLHHSFICFYGHIFLFSTNSTWVMMNEQTRRLSKMPEEVRDEIAPWFIEKQAIKEDAPDKIVKLDDKAKYVNSDLKVPNIVQL